MKNKVQLLSPNYLKQSWQIFTMLSIPLESLQ
jgi:hypothetical protein